MNSGVQVVACGGRQLCQECFEARYGASSWDGSYVRRGELGCCAICGAGCRQADGGMLVWEAKYAAFTDRPSTHWQGPRSKR
jgi:hypothetical protein